jgi:chromosome partitioning protein
VRTIAVVLLKGGQAKTTVALALAVGLAQKLSKGKRLLIVDADPNGDASSSMLNGQVPAEPTLRDVLLAQAEALEAIRPSRVPQIDLLPADDSLADCTLLLADQIGREHRLRSALESVEDIYDVCIIDAPPQMSLVNVNVLNAARELIVPMSVGPYPASSLDRLTQTVEEARKHLRHPDLSIIGLVLTMMTKNKATTDFEAEMREHYGTLVYASTIPYSIQVVEAAYKHLTVGEYAKGSAVAVAFDELTKEVRNHGQTKWTAKPNVRTDRRGKRRAG